MSEFVTELTSAESVHLAEVPNPTFLSLAPALIKKHLKQLIKVFVITRNFHAGLMYSFYTKTLFD